MRELILSILEKQGRSRMWLAGQAQDAGICSHSLVMQFLAGSCNMSTDKADALLGLLGVRVEAPTRRSHKARIVKK